MYVLETIGKTSQRKFLSPSGYLTVIVLHNCIYLWLNQQCIRAATSHSRRDSSFQEDLQQARCEFRNAPARFAKLVSLAGDEKEIKATQDSNNEAVTISDSPVDSGHQ